MSDINLLPIDLSANSTSAKLGGSIKRITIIVSIFFLVIAISGVGIIILLSRQSQALQANGISLKQQVQSLEATEQKLYLTKDRIQKIQLAESQRTLEKSFDTITKIFASLPPNVSANTIELDSSKNQFSVVSKSSIDMASFLNSLVASGIYKNLTLVNFFFTPDAGYTITLNAS